MNKLESFIHLKAFLEADSTIDKVTFDADKESFTVSYNGREYEISVWADRECSALQDVVKRLINMGNLKEYDDAPKYKGV